jgi:hypothetical protein
VESHVTWALVKITLGIQVTNLKRLSLGYSFLFAII